ncbi:pyridoxamine 5'-phosphate oxidase [Bacteroidota bacterium]
MSKDISRIRNEYKKFSLSKKSINKNPFHQLKDWINQAFEAQVSEPTVMMLATTGKDGKPSCRVVLLKKITEQGLHFFTNYASKKGAQIHENPYAAITFFWVELERQVRVEGKIEKLSTELSDVYFEERPFGSKIAAIISNQSETIESREILENEFQILSRKMKAKKVPRPDYWGGYILIPFLFEFWQGRPNRLHDRIAYQLRDKYWIINRLAP